MVKMVSFYVMYISPQQKACILWKLILRNVNSCYMGWSGEMDSSVQVSFLQTSLGLSYVHMYYELWCPVFPGVLKHRGSEVGALLLMDPTQRNADVGNRISTVINC